MWRLTARGLLPASRSTTSCIITWTWLLRSGLLRSSVHWLRRTDRATSGWIEWEYMLCCSSRDERDFASFPRHKKLMINTRKSALKEGGRSVFKATKKATLKASNACVRLNDLAEERKWPAKPFPAFQVFSSCFHFWLFGGWVSEWVQVHLNVGGWMDLPALSHWPSLPDSVQWMYAF